MYQQEHTTSVTPLVTLREIPNTVPFVLLQPGSYPAREGWGFNWICKPEVVEDVLLSACHSRICAVDLETKGGDYSSDISIVGIGLSWDRGSVYLPGPPTHDTLQFLSKHPGLIAHNAYFDWGVLRKLYPNYPIVLHACTYALYALLANESVERKWGLKAAQKELLGWPESNEIHRDDWLIQNGYSKGVGGNARPDLNQMWRVPTDILGPYCILDAESTYLLYTEVLEPVLLEFPSAMKYFFGEWMELISILVDQKIHGISMDRSGLEARREQLEEIVAEKERDFLTHPEVSNQIACMEQDLETPLYNAEPEKYRKQKLPKEPTKIRKDGSISKSWINWDSQMQLLLRNGPDVSKNWINWDARREQMVNRQLPEYMFNINSVQQLCELLYDRVGYPIRIYTDKGNPGIGAKAYKGMGEVGKLLTERMWAVKELTYVEKYIELLDSNDRIYPSFRVPGTVTGRLSSKGPNMQQIPKSKVVMDLFRAEQGKVWVDLDFAALEPTVVTEFSGDPNMARIYGDGVPANDIYLYVGANVSGEIGERIRATGYDPLNPSPTTVSRAKKECKKERSICKTVVLACQYGAGVNKIMQTLEADDIFLEYHEVAAIHSGYWSLFDRVKGFGRDLLHEWRDHKGYVLNGIGRPMCVPEDYTKDLLNRFIQSTGHDILVKYIYILTKKLTEEGIEWKPLVIDFHDASAVEIPENQLQRTIEIYEWSLGELNKQLGGIITLKGTPSYGTSLTDIKEPEE